MMPLQATIATNTCSIQSSAFIGKLALVTGGSGTIGRAIAAKFLRHGASVVLAARLLDRLESAAESIEGQLLAEDSASSRSIEPLRSFHDKIHCIPCDVADESSVVQMFESIDQRYRKSIDVLINNAGINIPGQTVDLSSADFEKVMQVNVTGSFLCAREAMKRMCQTNDLGQSVGGRIINIGSISAHSPRPDSCPYTTSKFALLGMTKSLALDGRRHGIAVGIIHPGNVESDLLTDDMKRERRETEGFLSAEDIADCVLTMASLPITTNVLEMTVLPTRQPLVGRG